MKGASLLLFVAGILLIAGCGTSTPEPTATPTPIPTPTPTPSPDDIARQAGRQMLSIDSVHFVVELSGKLTYLDDPPTLALKRMEGDLVNPDQVRAIVQASSFGVIAEIGVIGLGSDKYITNPLNQQWEVLGPELGFYFDTSLIFHPEYGIEAILEETNWTFGEPDVSQEGEYYLLQGQVPGERIAPLTFAMVTSGRVTVDVWVSRADYYVHRIELIELDSDPEDPTHWVMELSAFNAPVKIEAPPIP
jgi:hypothetical protein